MKPVITPAESARLDATATEPVHVLMERAGLGVALAAVEMGARYGTAVRVLAGPGNNGGDGYVAARHLARRGVDVTVHGLGYPRGESAARLAARAAVEAGVRTTKLGPPQPADLLIDAVFGAGFRGELPEAVAAWTREDTPVLAVDVPSGLDAATGEVRGASFTAARTVTFHALKLGHLLGEGPDRCGEVAVHDIGLPPYPVPPHLAPAGGPELLLCEDRDAPLPTPARTAHKWSRGGVLVVGGSPGITGAPLLAATAALNSGAGAAAIACPGGLAAIFEAATPGVMTVPVGSGQRFDPADAADLLDRAGRYGVIALGPGLGADQAKFVEAIVSGWRGKLVIDADGLNALPPPPVLVDRPGETILTPHAGEFRRIGGAEPTYRNAAEHAARSRATVVLKGNPTFVLGGERWVVTSGGPELASIGTGDVLTGMVAAFWAQGLGAETAARSAAHHHGRAGARLARQDTVTAERLAAGLGRLAR